MISEMKKKAKGPKNPSGAYLPDHYCSTDQAAAMKGVGTHAVRAAIREGRLPAHRIGGRWLLRRVDVESWQPMHSRARPKKEETNG